MKIFVTHLIGISIVYRYTCVYNVKFIGIKKEKEICLLYKEYISINMVARNTVHMHIIAELKAHWLS